MLIVFELLFCAASFFGMNKCLRKQREIARYEFENSTDGGVVIFSSFEESEKHKRSKSNTQFGILLCGMCFVGSLGFILVYILVKLPL
jgi:hypothetical protein